MGFGLFFKRFSSGVMAQPASEYAIDQEFIELAIELIDEIIPTPNATWKTLSPGISPIDEPWRTTPGPTILHPIRIVFYRKDLQDKRLLQRQDDMIANEGYINGLFYHTDFVPTEKDVLIWRNRELAVVDFNDIIVVKDTILHDVRFKL